LFDTFAEGTRSMTDLLETPIDYLKGVGPKRALLLKKELNISTYSDMLSWYPFRYIDKSRIYKIAELTADMAYVQIRAKVLFGEMMGKGSGTRLVVKVSDGTGELDLIFFQGIKWVKDKFQTGAEFIFFGKPALFNGRLNIAHPEMELVSEFSAQPADPLHPMYNTTEKLKHNGLTSRTVSKLMKTLMLQVAGHITENLSENIKDSLKLISREQAVLNIHFPTDTHILKRAETRLKFEELFFIQLKLLRFKLGREIKIKGLVFEKIGELFNGFYHNELPFELTNAQKRVLKEIRKDLASGKQMNRLLQGDVGSGKTLVALMSMLMALDNGYQACLMAPTEILAQQHYKTISRFLANMPVHVELLTGSTKTAHRKRLAEWLKTGELHIIIGTHALVENTVSFGNLGLVVIDEQHRFGVEQRAKLWNKSMTTPHVLVMTATPIPRTLAMTVYGDLDVSVIDELPPGRKPIKTYHYYENGREKVFAFIRNEIAKGRQIYIVYPLIEESETLDLKNLAEGYEHIKAVFPEPLYHVSMVHGKLKNEEKESEMKRFVSGETQIMVATTVIEVGVDVPNASVMVIENAERFGLSQLHQLRGRIGRGAEQSHCILLSGYKLTTDGRKRIETMVRTTDGFEISEVDMQIRGPGDLEGTRQSGILDLKISNIIKDEAILKIARQKAREIIDGDSLLAMPENLRIKTYIQSLESKRSDWAMIS
jgi:ATP-dependent DNA helicase RecG